MGCHCLFQCIKVKNESEVAQSCPTLSDPMDYSLPGSSVHGIFQARVLEWVAIAFSSQMELGLLIQSLFQNGCLLYWDPILKVKSKSEVAQSCPTLSDPMDCSLPGSSVHGIFQARVLEWGAITFSDIVIYFCL